MKYLELTFPDAAQNLACDEALLEFFEQSDSGEELLRLWHPDNTLSFWVMATNGARKSMLQLAPPMVSPCYGDERRWHGVAGAGLS